MLRFALDVFCLFHRKQLISTQARAEHLGAFFSKLPLACYKTVLSSIIIKDKVNHVKISKK